MMTIALVQTVLIAMVMLSELIACSAGSGLRGPISTGLSGVPTSALSESESTDSGAAQMTTAPPEARGGSTSTTHGPATIISKAYPSYCLSVGSGFDPKAGAILLAAPCNVKDSAQLFTFAGQVKPVVRQSQMLHYATSAVWIPVSASDGRRRISPRGVKVVAGTGHYWEVDEHARIIDKDSNLCLTMQEPPKVTRETCALGEPSQQWEGLTCQVGDFTIRGYWEAFIYIHGQDFSTSTTFGSERTSTQTNFQEWGTEVTTEVSAGFEVEGIGGASVSVSGSISESLGQEYQEAFKMSTTQTVEIKLPVAGQWWRWAFVTTDLCGNTTTTVNGEFAVTHSVDEQPCCVPGGFVNASDYFEKQCLDGAHMPQGTPGCSFI